MLYKTNSQMRSSCQSTILGHTAANSEQVSATARDRNTTVFLAHKHHSCFAFYLFIYFLNTFQGQPRTRHAGSQLKNPEVHYHVEHSQQLHSEKGKKFFTILGQPRKKKQILQICTSVISFLQRSQTVLLDRIDYSNFCASYLSHRRPLKTEHNTSYSTACFYFLIIDWIYAYIFLITSRPSFHTPPPPPLIHCSVSPRVDNLLVDSISHKHYQENQ